MNKLKKYSKIILILFFISIISIIAPNIVSAYEDGDITVVEQATNTKDTGSSFVIQYPDLSGANENTWYMICDEHGGKLRSVDTLYTLEATHDADTTSEEAYILSNLDEYNYKGFYLNEGQNAWWNRGNFSTEPTTDTMYVQNLHMGFDSTGEAQLASLVTSGDIANLGESTVKNRLRTIINEHATNSNKKPAQTSDIDRLYNDLLSMYSSFHSGQSSGALLTEEAKAFQSYIKRNQYNNQTTTYTINGITVTAPVLNMNTTLEDDDATVAFSEDDNAYLIGPFKLIYPEGGYTSSDGTYVMFAGLDETDFSLETNLGVMNFGTDWTLSYTSPEAADVHGLPKSGYEFYVALKYKPGMTQVTKLEFTYKYMNAGGTWNEYAGQMKQCQHCGTYNAYNATTCVNGCGYWDHSGCDHSEDNYHCDPVWRYYHDFDTVHCQKIAILVRSVRWYEYQKVQWEGIEFGKSSITVNKKTVDENGNTVRVDDTFYFDIYVDYHDGQGEKLFETLAVSTKDGSGKKTSTTIYWEGRNVPTYRVEEHDKDGYSIDGPWEGTLTDGQTITIYAENYVEPDKGRIEINKRIINDDANILESEIFTFTINVWGTFRYNDVYATYTASSPLKITATIQGSGTWSSANFEWYGDAPQYRVTEIVLEDAIYKVVGSNDETGTLVTNDATVPDGEMLNTQVEIINEPDTDWSRIYLDKKIVNGSDPEPGEVFTARVTITGDFIYNNTEYTANGNPLEITVTLNEANNWSWVSDTIYWTTTVAPQYTVEETSMPDNYEFSSITDQNKSTTTNDFNNSLQSGNMYVTIYNDETDQHEGSIRVIKLSETDDLINKTFSFEITVTGNFTYNGTEYTENAPLVIRDSVKAVTSEAHATIKDETLKEYGPFTWDADEDAPEYTVTETGLEDREDASFVSISNNNKTVTNTPSITDDLLPDNTVVIKMLNRGNEPETTRIQIVKETIGNTEYLDGLDDSEKTFRFTVEITGTFVYTATNGTIKNVNNDTLTLNDLEDVSVIGKGNNSDPNNDNNIWISGEIRWNDDVTAPTYRVTEVDIPDYAEFVSWSNRTNTVETTFISGTLSEDQTNVLTAINNINVEPEYGRLQIFKKAQTDNISNDTFTFNVTVTGDFTYGEGADAREYPTPDGDPLSLSVNVKANGDAWVSDIFSWEGEAPTYTIEEVLTEEQIDSGIEFVSISNETQRNTSNSITGTLQGSSDATGSTVATVTAVNKKDTEPFKSRIQITKEFYMDEDPNGNQGGNEIDGVVFKFEVTITYYNDNGDVRTTVTIPVEIESGTTWRSDYFYWESTEPAPTYQVTEVSTGDWTASINPDSGTLENNSIISITARNIGTPKSGNLKITKLVDILDKVGVTDYKGTFTFNVTVNGTFSYTDSNNRVTHYVNDTMSLKVTINIDGTQSARWESGTFSWVGDAPTYAVEEVNIPTGWWLYEMSNSSGSLVNGQTVDVSCTNQTGPDVAYILTMEMGGKVWDDTDYSAAKEADKVENGLIDEGEPGIEGVKVTVTRLVTDSNGRIIARLNPIYAYDENDNLTPIDNFDNTDSDGNWSFGSISVPAFNLEDPTENSYYNAGYDVSYDVTFTYDGQTYEPTTFLATSNGDVNAFRSASTSGRDAWLKDSMAIDKSSDRESFNSKFTNIEGYSPIQSDGTTIGMANDGNVNNITLNYSSTDSISVLNSDNTRKISTLDTYDDNGNIYSDFTIDASTQNGGLTYPFDDEYHLESWDKKVDPITGLSKTTYHFSATYNYLLSINLGLLKREAADIATEKDLTEATVAINGKVMQYKFNSAIDLTNPDNFELLYKQIAVADEQIEYTLGLYSSDYYYRASIYDGSDVGNALDGFYTGTLGLPVESTELEIYLKYTINVYNESDTYDVTINGLADYYDSTFELITSPDSQSRTYIQTLNGQEVNATRNLAEASTVTYYASNGDVKLNENNAPLENIPLTWSGNGTVKGSDGIAYNRISTVLYDIDNPQNNQLISSGERAEVTLTFKVVKNTSTDGYAIPDSIMLGEKHNLVELRSFSSYYSNTSKNKWSSPGQVAGRVDEDSAPDNINIPEYNDKTWYEDDTDSAPILTVELYNKDRDVNGLVWEDAQTNTVQYSQTIGDGVYNPDQGDKAIPGLTTEIIETVSVPTGDTDSSGNTVYKEYEFIWPTSSTEIDGLNGKSLEQLTGFDSTITTNAAGEYDFTAVPAGNYKVRFVYGDKDIATGNSGYEEVYNGQDYKSTSYEVGFDNDSDDDGYTDNEWHDLSNDDLDASRVSDARDVEARRLYVASKSEMLVYDNTRVFETADDFGANHDELYGNTSDRNGTDGINYQDSKATDQGPIYGDGYYMYAETAKLNIEVENIYDINYTTETIGQLDGALAVDGDIDKGAVAAGNKFTYSIDNIDFGLEERSQTKLTLDKQIKEITLTTSDNNVILDAVYDISYELGDDDTIKSSVTLNRDLSTGYENIASLNRSSSAQGYRYIMAEGTILQGATITVKYQFTVFNVGEADTCNQILKDIWTKVNSAGYDTVANTAVNSAIERLSSPLYTAAEGRMWSDLSGKYQYGTYFGSIYYLGTQGTYTDDNILVESTIHQIIDYVDPDVEFTDVDNIAVNQSWSATSTDDLMDYADDGLIDPDIIQIVNSDGEPVIMNEAGDLVTAANGELISKVTYYNYNDETGDSNDISNSAYTTLMTGFQNGTYRYTVINDYLQEYNTDSKNNIIMSIDNGLADAEAGTNPSLVKATTPYTAENNYDNATASINLTVSRYYSSEEDSSDIDNIAEIIKVENTVGRRDVRTVAGNTSTYELNYEPDNPAGYDDTVDIYTIAGEEPDTSATEVITLSPPTGLNPTVRLVLQIIGVVLIAGIVIAVGIIVIRKKVLLIK